VNSPAAPAGGCSVTASIPPTAASASWSRTASSSVPWTVPAGRSGWRPVAVAATSSVNAGLYFIVHDPSGNGPLSIP